MWKKPKINKPNFNNNFSEISDKELMSINGGGIGVQKIGRYFCSFYRW